VRDESRFWSLVCHGPPSVEAAATIEPPARKCWRLNASADVVRESVHSTGENFDGEFCRKFVCSVTFAARERAEALKVG
jgi:hypothetical protein